MLSFRKEHAAVLLLAVAQSVVLTSSSNGHTRQGASAKMVTLVDGPWVDKVNSVIPFADFDNTTCMDEVVALLESFASGEPWALQMIDASSKIQSGILQGNIRDLGMYEQCVSIDARYNDTNIRGKYCTVTFNILSSAVCVPSSCNESQVAEVANLIIQNITAIDDFELEISGVSCVAVGSEDFTVGEIATMAFFLTVGIFMVFCTICEFVLKMSPTSSSGLLSTLAKFSLYTNAMSLLSTRSPSRMMPAIQGIRFLSICWVILGHRYVLTSIRPMVNSVEVLDWYSSWTAVYIQAAPFAVDTFFVISGFLMTYLFIKSQQAGKKINYLMMYIHRYLRITPSQAVLMLFVAVLLPRVANGPLWSSLLELFVKPCQKKWWVNLLYVQNFDQLHDMCLAHSWYLAVDMQLFWISPFILYPLHRWPKFGLGLLFLFLAASIVTPAIVLAVNGYSNALTRPDSRIESILDNFVDFYTKTYTRACAYFVGLLLGYDVATKNRNFSQMTVVINWTVSTIFLAICGWSTHLVYSVNFDYNLSLEILFAIILRPLWSVAIAWIVYASTHGYAGIVGRFLSQPIFVPLSRLSYCIYLVHMVIIAAKSSAEQTTGRFTDFLVFNHFWADLVTSIAVAFVFSLFFESPVMVLEKILTAPGPGRERPSPMQHLAEVEPKPACEMSSEGLSEI